MDVVTPTREEIKQRVEDNFACFVSDIDCYTLSDWLLQARVMTTERWEHIQNTNPTDRRRNRALMNWLFDTANPNAFTVLWEALKSENHWLLTLIDQPKKPVVPSNDEIKARVEDNYQFFVSDIDAESLSYWLLQKHVVACDKLREIQSKWSTARDRNRALLDCLFGSTDPNAFTVLRECLERENHWLLTVIDDPMKSPSEVSPKILAQDDLLAEIKQLKEENTKLREKCKDAQENLRREQEQSRGVTRKEWASTMKPKQLTIELRISEKQMFRNIQELGSLERKLKQGGSLLDRFRTDPLVPHFNHEEKNSGSSEGGEHALAIQIEGQDCSSIVVRRCSGLDVGPAQEKLDQTADHLEAMYKNKETKQGEFETPRLNLHPTQKDPLIIEKAGYSCKGKLCELRIRPEFPGYGFSFDTEQSGRQFYSHKVKNVERNSPAERSGLVAGDRIAEVNGVSVIWKLHSEALTRMRKFSSRLTLFLLDKAGERALQESIVDVSKGIYVLESVRPNIAHPLSCDSSLSPTEENKICYYTDPVLVQTIRTVASERDDGLICGIATLDNELFIVKDDRTEVEIYDSSTFCFLRQWTLEELVALWDISSCNRNKCLYILNYENASHMDILIVAPNGILINSFSTGDDFAKSLSVTDKSNVVLAIYLKNKLNEYTSDGQIIREINLLPETGIIHPLHSIKLANGQYAVCHGDQNDSLQRVCIVSIEGRIERSFGDKFGATLKQMDSPLHLAIDKKGRIIVADYGNGRVLLLNSDLSVERVLLETKHGLRLPWRIHLNATDSRLFVSDSDYSYEKHQHLDSKLFVFQFR